MDRQKKSSLLRKLRALVEHPTTPEHERDSARARIGELTRPQPVPRRPPDRPKAEICGDRLRVLRARPKGEPAFPEQWPFGWTGSRGHVEHEVAATPDGGMAIGWKCPGCGAQVERRITERMMRQLLRPVPAGKPSPLVEHIRGMVGGAQNQLCRLCWARWEDA